MDLLYILKTRFEENRHRHPELDWEAVEGRLRDRPECQTVLQCMEDTGGEPDVIGTDENGEYASTGADQTVLDNGDEFSLVYTKDAS